MKTTRALRSFLLASSIVFTASPVLHAAVYYWDTDGTGTAGFGNSAGTWGSSVFWSTDSTGANVGPPIVTATTLIGDDVNFGTATLALGATAANVAVTGTVNANSITFGAGQTTPIVLSGGTAINLAAAATITVNNTSDTIGTAITGAATSFTKAGTGTLILSGANTYTGNTTVSAGTLTLATGGSLYNTATAATITVSTGANLNITSSATNVTNSAGNGATAKTWTVGGTINVTGGGAETLGNTVNLNGGTLTSSGATNAFGSYYVNALGTSITATGANTISGNAIGHTATLTLSPTGSSDTIAVSAILGITGSAGGSLVKTGAGTVTLSGNNTYTGTTTISAGTLKLQGGAFSTTARTYSISSGSVLNLDGNTSTANGIIINGTGTLRITGGQLAAGAATRFVSMNLGAGGLIDIQAGASTAGYYQGINWTSNLASLNLNGSFDVWDGNSPTVDALTGSGSITKGTAATTQTITVGAANGSGTFTGTISNAAGAVNLTKNGTGKQTLSGANTYTGTTTVNAGTLALGIIGTTGAKLGVTAVTVNTGGTFAVIPGAVTTTANSSIGSTLTLNSGAAFTMADTVANQFNVLGAATLAPASGTAPVLTFDIVGAANDRLAITGAATVGAGGAKITIAPSTTALTAGSYTVISAASGLNTNFSLTSSVVSNTGGLFTLSLSSSTATAEIVTVAANAAALYWKGAGTAWNTAGNWTIDQAGTAVSGSAPVSTTDVAFSAATPANLTTNTLTAPLTVNSVNFLPGAGSVTVVTSANALTINGGGITNNSANAMTINNPITLGAAQTWTNSGGLLTIGGAITNGANTLTVAGAGNTTIGSVLGSGAGGLTMNGGGTLTLTGTNTFTGATTISAGTLMLGDGTGNTGNLSATSAISVASGATLAVNRTGATSQATDLSGKIMSGAGSFLQAGSGTTTLSLVNTYTGSTIISGGTLQIASTGRLGNGSYAGAITFSNNSVLQYSSSGALQTLSGAITGAGGLTKDTNTSDLALSNTGNNYTGTTTVTSGRIQVTAPGNLSNGATSIVQSGTGQLFISNSSATFSNPINISTIGFSEGDAQGNIDGAIRMDGTNTLSGTITLSGNARIGAYSTALNTISGPITGSAGIEFYGMNNANSAAEVFVISNTANNYTGATTISNSNYGTPNLTGVSTTLKLGASNVIPDGASASNVAFASYGTNINNTVTLDLNGFSDTINGLTVNAGANAKITNTAAATSASVLTIGANNTSSSFGGTITDSGAGRTLAITKIGTNTLTLSGANSFIGGLTIKNGTVSATTAANALGGSGTGAVTLGDTTTANGATLTGSGLNFANPITLAGSGAGTLTIGNSATGAIFSGGVTGSNGFTIANNGSANTITFQTGSLANVGRITNTGTSTGATTISSTITSANNVGVTQNSAGSLVLSGASNGYTGTTVISQGSLKVSSAGALSTSSVSMNGASTTLEFNTVSQTITNAIDVTSAATGALIYSNTQITTLNGPITVAAPTTFQGAGNANSLNTGSGGTITSSNSSSITISANNTGANTYAGAISLGTGSITRNGSGNMTLSNTGNSFSGGLNISSIGTGAGTAQSATTLITVGAQGSGDITFISGNTAPITFTGAGTVANNILSTGGGSGGILKKDATVTTLSGTSNNYIGATVISAGTLVMASTQALGTNAGGVTISGGTLDIATAGGDTAYNFTVGSTSIGTIISNVASGTTGINHTMGSLAIGGTTIVGATKLNITAGTGLTGTPTITLSGLTMSSLTANGVSTLNPTTAGLIVGTVTGGGTGAKVLNLDGTNTGNQITGIISDGTGVSVTKTNTSTWTLSGANTYTGGTTISAGILQVNVNDALGTNAAGTSVTAGAALKLNGVNYSTTEALSINGTGISGGGALVNTGTSTYAGLITAATSATINAGSGTLNLTGGLVKNGTTLTLTGGGTININGTGISGSLANSDLIVNGTTVNLNVTSSYNGPTSVIGAGTLVLGVNDAIPGNSAVTLGDASTTGTLNMVGFTNSIGSLSFGAGGGTLKMAANQTGSAQLAASGTVALGTTNTLDLTGMGTSAGVYKLISGSSLSGTFGTVTGLDSNYALQYGNLTANELDAQHKSTIALALGSNAANVHVGSQTVNLSIGNSAPSGSADLSYTLGGVTGSPGTRIAGAGSSAATGTYTAAAGVNSFNITASDAAATNSPQTVAFSQTGYRLATGNTTDVNLGKARVGDSSFSLTNSLTVLNTATNDIYSEKLNATAGSQMGDATAPSGSASLVVAGSSSTAIGVGLSTTSSGNKTGTVGVSYTSDGTGTSGLGTSATNGPQTINLSGTVYDYASKSLSGDGGLTGGPSSYTYNFGTVNQGDAASTTLNLANLSVSGFQDKLGGSFSYLGNTQFTTLTGLITAISAGSSNNYGITFDTSALGTFNGTLTFNGLSQQIGLLDASVGSYTIAITGTVVIPEPNVAALIGGFGMLALLRRRR